MSVSLLVLSQDRDGIEKSENEKMPTFLIYGELAPVDYLDDENVITEKYGFKLRRVAGCAVSLSLVISVKLNNRVAFRRMNKRYGEDWMQRFENETNWKLAIPDIED